MNSKYRILYVDDEEVNLRVFLGSFRRDYHIFTAQSGKQALEMLTQQPVELVISDQRMPQMTGIEFLKKVREFLPDTKLILLTGFSDVQAIIEGINECKIYNYISKPWIESDLRLKIGNALESFELQRHNQQLINDLQAANLQLEEHADSLEQKVAERTQKIKEQNLALWKKNQEIENKNYELVQAQHYIKKVNEQLVSANNSLEDKVAERTRKLQQLNLELQKSNEELDLFIYRASHDLRGPLSTIQGLANLAQFETENLSDYLEAITTTTNKMDKTLHKLQYINAINHAENANDLVNIAHTLEHCYQNYSLKLSKYGIHFTNEVPSDLHVETNAMLFKIILDNLLENAMYFRTRDSQKSPFIRVWAEENQSQIKVCVGDNGIGIAAEYHQKIFQMFVRASEVSKGNGLGLYVVKKASEKLEIEILVDSQANQGATFMLVLNKK